MDQFASAHHLASWIGVCPGQNESAGVSKSGRTPPGNANLKRLIGIAVPWVRVPPAPLLTLVTCGNVSSGVWIQNFGARG